MRFTVLLFLIFNCFVNAQTRFHILDQDSQKPISNVSVYFNEGNLIFSNNEGQVHIPKEFQVDELIIVKNGYVQKMIKISDISNSVVYLTNTDEVLPEVALKTVKKEKLIKHKATRRKSAFDGIAHYHGWEYGVYIKNPDPEQDLQLMEITIPVISKSYDWKRAARDRKKLSAKQKRKGKGVRTHILKNEFTYLYEINFYHIKNDTVFDRINTPPVYQIITSDENLYKINLEKDRLFADDNGIMVGVKNLGPCDEKGKLLPIPRYKSEKMLLPDGRRISVQNNRETMPLFGMTSKRKDNSLNFRNFHRNASSRFNLIKEGHLGGIVGGAQNQLSLGYRYKLISYEK